MHVILYAYSIVWLDRFSWSAVEHIFIASLKQRNPCEMATKHKPLLDEFEGKEHLTSYDFIRIFQEFDKDGKQSSNMKTETQLSSF